MVVSVLIACADRALSTRLYDQLASRGHHVRVTMEPDTNAPDVIISDLGVDFVRRCQPLSAQMIVVTDEIDVAVACMRLGASDCLRPPADIEQVVASIADALARRETGAEASRQAGVLALENTRLLQKLVVSERLASIGQLAASVAHEINNPVSYILASQSSLAEQIAAIEEWGRLIDSSSTMMPVRAAFERAGGAAFIRQLREATDDIREGGLRVRDIVRDVWSFARSDENTSSVFDVNEAIRAAIRITTTQVKHRAKIQLSLGVDVTVRGNIGRISQVIVNLLVNAAQAFVTSIDNEIVITSRREADDVIVRVVDNGPGIQPEHLPRIFDAFFTTKAETTGMGLGLAISRDIVRSHGGELRVESQVERGASFELTLPAAYDSAVPIEVHALEQSQAMPRATRILFVDDEAGIRRGYQRAFERHYDIVVADNGDHAWEILQVRRKFDVIVCDLLMPGTGGAELYDRVRSTFPELVHAFVFVTGGISDPRVLEFLKTCGNPLLEKPFEMTELKNLVEARRPTPRYAAG